MKNRLTLLLAVLLLLSSSLASSLTAQEGKVLRVAWGKPAVLDPISASADSEIAFLNAVYDYLIDTNASSELVPRLAESWDVSEDGAQYTLHIRKGVKFHDGSDLTLDDILWTFEYLRADEASSIAQQLSGISEIAAGEGNSLVFTLTASTPDFLYTLSDNRIVILQQDAENIGTEFNGTGPFKLDSYTPGDRAIFSANADYWGAVPAFAALEFIFFDTIEAQVSALQGGQVDAVLRLDNPTFAALAADSNFTAISIPTSGHDVVRLRADREPGNNPLVQQAFKLATDRQAIYERIQLGYGSVGKDSPIGPVYGDYFNADLTAPARDAEAAKALLAEAGYPNGLDLTLYVPNSGDRPQLAETLAAQWAEAGIRVEIQLQEESAYYADDGWLEVDLGITGWGARPTPQIFLEEYLRTGAAWNESHFSDPELDALIDRAGVSLIPQERVAIYQQIQVVLLERGPVIIPYFFAQFLVHDADISGIDLHPFAGRTNFNTAEF